MKSKELFDLRIENVSFRGFIIIRFDQQLYTLLLSATGIFEMLKFVHVTTSEEFKHLKCVL